jgi:hypothetical protein
MKKKQEIIKIEKWIPLILIERIIVLNLAYDDHIVKW